ncbi:MAG: glycosyltransferase [Lachnospiraceae bacterium]|nr:glycosyltransferase [Candidatus Colinaster equi]
MARITFVTLSLQRGGAEGVIARLCNDELIKNHEVNIVMCMCREVQYELDQRIRLFRVDDGEIQYANMASRFAVRRKRLDAILQELNSDVIISFLPEPNFLVLSMRRKVGCPVIISVRNDPAREYANKAYNIMMKQLYPKADGYVFQTEDAKAYFSCCNKITDRGVVIPNALTRSHENMTPVSQRKKSIVHVGRLDRQKNHKLLIDAFIDIADKYPEYTLDLYGEGALENDLRKYIGTYAVEDRIIFHGNVKNLHEKIKDASMFVLTSDYEGMPNALMEALALGIPCIATDCPCGGPKALIKHEHSGLLVPVGDQKALMSAMERLLDNRSEAEEMAKNAIDSMHDYYADIIHAKWAKYIEDIIAKKD